MRAKAGIYAMAISFCSFLYLFVCSYIACKICEAIRYVAAADGKE